jgi:hypothetical protein
MRISTVNLGFHAGKFAQPVGWHSGLLSHLFDFPAGVLRAV